MPLFGLEPAAAFLDDEDWSASTHKDVVYVEAATEKEARQIAHDNFWIAASKKTDGAIPLNPWKSSEKVLCKEIGQGKDLPDPGAILLKAKP